MSKVAVVTGSTRGIGRACALSLAGNGFKVVVTGRTLREGQGTVVRPFSGDTSLVTVPGSIESTVAAIRASGGEAIGVALDIMSRSSIDAMVDAVSAEWGRIDVLVNNAIYNGPGLMYGFDDFSMDQMEACLTGTVINQVYVTRKVLPGMRSRGNGAIFFIGSVAGLAPPPAPVSNGGWGFLHGASKSAFHRIAEFLHLEHHKNGIRSFLVEPQMTVTESMKALLGDMTSRGGGRPRGFPPEVTGEVVAWLATQDEDGKYAGRILSTPTFFRDHDIARS